MRPALFIDKDGTLVEDVPYNVDPDLVRLQTGATEALSLISSRGLALVLVTNQSGLARGMFQRRELDAALARVEQLLAAGGVQLDGIFVCPHHPKGSVPELTVRCPCRKPAAGLLRRAARELDLDLRRSWMVGDILDDVEAGHRAGCRSILLDLGGETEWRPGPGRTPDAICASWQQVPEALAAPAPSPGPRTSAGVATGVGSEIEDVSI